MAHDESSGMNYFFCGLLLMLILTLLFFYATPFDVVVNEPPVTTAPDLDFHYGETACVSKGFFTGLCGIINKQEGENFTISYYNEERNRMNMTFERQQLRKR